MSTEQTAQPHSIEQLHTIVSVLANFIWTGKLRPGEHLWTIPADPKRDFDIILSDAINELEANRRRLAEVTRELAEARERVQVLEAAWIEAREIAERSIRARQAAEATIASLRDQLRTFGEHTRSCATRSTSTEMWPKCNCGLTAALAASAAAGNVTFSTLTTTEPSTEGAHLGQCQTCGHHQEIPSGNTPMPSSMAAVACQCENCGGSIVVTYTIMTAAAPPDDLTTLSPGDPRYLSSEAQIARLDHLIAYVQAHAPDAQVEAWLRARRDVVREQIAPADPPVTKTP